MLNARHNYAHLAIPMLPFQSTAHIRSNCNVSRTVYVCSSFLCVCISAAHVLHYQVHCQSQSHCCCFFCNFFFECRCNILFLSFAYEKFNYASKKVRYYAWSNTKMDWLCFVVGGGQTPITKLRIAVNIAARWGSMNLWISDEYIVDVLLFCVYPLQI